MTQQNQLYITYAALGMSAVALYMLWRETQKKNGAVQKQEQAENNLADAAQAAEESESAEEFAGAFGIKRRRRRGKGRLRPMNLSDIGQLPETVYTCSCRWRGTTCPCYLNEIDTDA